MCYYNVVGKISLQDIISFRGVTKISYVICANGKVVANLLSFEDTMYYINSHNLSIIEETEDFENFVITLDCEEV